MSTVFASMGTLPTANSNGKAGTTASLVATSTDRAFSTNSPLDTETLLDYFTEPYFLAHELSWPSYRYAYILWIVVGGCAFLWAVCHVLVFHRNTGGVVGAAVRKIAMKRVHAGSTKAANPSLSQKRRPFWVSPPLGFVALMVAFTVAVFCLSYVGPDYLAPMECTWGGVCPVAVSAKPPKTTFKSSSVRRQRDWTPALPLPARSVAEPRPLRLSKRADLNPNGWAPFDDPLLAGPNYRIAKNLWTSSSRVGMIAYALMPLSVALALKMWPFAVFSTPVVFDTSYNRLTFFHAWFGRLIFALSTVHVGLWMKQLGVDKDPFGRPVLVPAFQYWRFQAGWAAYVAICAITLLSLPPIRKRYYEFFLYSHVALVVAFLIGCGLHYRYLGPYCFIALGIWGAERLFRTLIWLWINGFLSGLGFSGKSNKRGSFTRVANPAHDRVDDWTADTPGDTHTSHTASHLPAGARPAPPRSSNAARGSGFLEHFGEFKLDPPPGFAVAQLLPGNTIRLTLRPAKRLKWKTGQHISLTLPAIRFWQGHPYTIASADPNIASLHAGDIPTMTILIRARRGFSKLLQTHLIKQKQLALNASPHGLLMRACVSLPLGSRSRGRYEDFGTAFIICGGSGVSFGLAVFEHCCAQLATRAQRIKLTRIRFVWLLKEFSHLSWIAPVLRQIMDQYRSDAVKIDFYVTNQPTALRPPRFYDEAGYSETTLAPPAPNFLRDTEKHYSTSSGSDGESSDSETPALDIVRNDDEDLVHFDGEEEATTAAEQNLSQSLEKEGIVRRARSRKRVMRGSWWKRGSVDSGAIYPPAPTAKLPAPTDSTLSIHATSRSMATSPSQDSEPSAPHMPLDRGISASRDSSATLHSMLHLTESAVASTLDISGSDERDIAVLAEFARTGRPDIAAMLDEEILGASTGGIVVACCGPATLNTLVRTLIGRRIRPTKDPLGLIVEDFDD